MPDENIDYEMTIEKMNDLPIHQLLSLEQSFIQFDSALAQTNNVTKLLFDEFLHPLMKEYSDLFKDACLPADVQLRDI